MVLLTVIWGVFAGVFLGLGIFHWNMRKDDVSHFKVEEKKLPEGVTVGVTLGTVDFFKFVDKFNGYIDEYNEKTRKQHEIQAIGYYVAGATAIFSLVISLVG